MLPSLQADLIPIPRWASFAKSNRAAGKMAIHWKSRCAETSAVTSQAWRNTL